ncbi:hypothetical protein Tco_0890543 [Tanacetum coccineum]|uniref:Uncharacterized protein n=1 Tax=Tanacetum coccineum TaxID=301880 RepID=A0ABQ5C0R7_9ASTR
MIFKQQQSDKEDKYLNDILQLQDKTKDLENVVCNMCKSTETLWLLTNEQRAYRDNIQTLEDAEKSRLKMKEFQKDEKPQVQKENLRSTLSEFAINHILGKDDSSSISISESNIFELEKESGENICENEKCKLQTKIVKLEKVLTQKTKDFDDVKLELSNRMAKFEAYFEKLENTKVVLERKLARKVDDSKAEKD